MQFNFKKKYGQNFLQNSIIVEKIVNSFVPNPDDLIIEIGPGSGALTKKLKKHQANLLAYEIDEDTKPYLTSLEDQKTHVIYGDFLKCNLKHDLEAYQYQNLYIIGNLPYYITTPIIMHIIDSGMVIKEMIFMVQHEVALRFAAHPGTREYGSITVILNYFFEIEKLFIVSKQNFIPKPQVDSAVIRLRRKKDIADIDYEEFKHFVNDCFQFKRKNLRNNLKKYDLNKLQNILDEYDYTLDDRAENLPLAVFIALFKSL